MNEEQATTQKRQRKTASEARAAKIAKVEEQIQKHRDAIRELEAKLEELKRPPQLSDREKQALLKAKIDDGALTEEEAYQLGYKG